MGLAKKWTAIIPLDGGDVLEKLVEKHLPELDLNTIEAPIICTPCHESLKDCSHFVTSCLIVEEKIMEYRKLTGADAIEIADIQLTSRNVSRVENITNDVSAERKFCVDMGNADEQVGQENDSFVHMEEQKVLLNEDIEIKTDQHDFDRLLDGVVSPQPVTKSRGKEKFLMSHGGPLKTSNKHKQAHGVSKARMHQCDSCSFQTKHKQNIRRHMVIHKLPTETTMYQCDSCSFNTKYKNGLHLHMKIHKEPSEVKIYQCYICSHQTIHRTSFLKHVLTHRDRNTETTTYQCEFCSHCTKYKSSLQRHMLIHKNSSEVTTYRCDSCSFRTKHKNSLRGHMLIHKSPSEAKSYRCESCSFQTNHKTNIRRHMITHKLPSEITMYQCNFCSYKTKHKHSVRGHMLVHKNPSELTMSQCPSCSFKTKRKESLDEQVSKHEILQN